MMMMMNRKAYIKNNYSNFYIKSLRMVYNGGFLTETMDNLVIV